MNCIKRQWKIPTYIKYFLSYFFIVTVLVLSFFFVIRSQLVEKYFNQQVDVARMRLDVMAEKLNEDLTFLMQIDSSIESNKILLEQRYGITNFSSYIMKTELEKYDTSSLLISDIVYYSKRNDCMVTTSGNAFWKDGKIFVEGIGQGTLVIDPTPCWEEDQGKVISLFDENQTYLIYFPDLSKQADYIYFYFLDGMELEQRLQNLISLEVPAAALFDGNGQVIKGINDKELTRYLDDAQPKSGIYSQNLEYSLCVSEVYNWKLYVVSMLSDEFLNQQTTIAFTGTYLALLTLGVIGFFMIFIAMKVTYLPLRRLTQRIASDVPESTSHLERLENTFFKVTNQNQAIQKKLDAYRSFMHESLINSFLSSKQNEGNVLLDMDVFMDRDSNKEILVIYMSASGGEFNSHEYAETLKSTLVCVEQCVMIETKPDGAVFLVACNDEIVNVEEKILGLLQRFWQERGWMSVVSRSSDSLLNIPSLYESVMSGSKFWPQIAVVDCRKQEKTQGITSYPHDKLDDLATAFAESDFSAARELVVELFELVGSYFDKDESIQNYLIPCILIDVLTSIANSMSQARIALVSYDTLYYETLYLCRSCYSQDNVTAITVNIEKLLDIYEQECMEKMINTAMVRQVIEECCCQPEFSIAVLADKFHVSVGYMSYLFKTEFNITFSDYLWELRLKKTKELLLSTEMSVEEISESVGYYSVSGFRRKFKKETGMTPSQFKENAGRE